MHTMPAGAVPAQKVIGIKVLVVPSVLLLARAPNAGFPHRFNGSGFGDVKRHALCPKDRLSAGVRHVFLHVISTPAQAHHVMTAHMPAHGKHTRSSASCHNCTHAGTW